jgi:diaminopimelate epimerase
MSQLINHSFYQMNGAGNRIIVVDVRESGAKVTATDAINIHKTPSLAFDQMMVLMKPRVSGVESTVQIYNNDGSMSGACGNGSRCAAWWAYAGGAVRSKKFRVRTVKGVLSASVTVI